MRFLNVLFSLVLIFTILQCEKKTKPYTFLALGDSYTIGESVAKKDRWPQQLVKTLEKDGIKFEPPTLIAKTGWTTGELKSGIDNTVLNYPYDWVSLMIGVNNQYRGLSLDQFREEFETLLQMAITFAGNKKDQVFVLSIPDWGAMPFAKGRNREEIARQIDDFNQVIYEVCALEEITFIDITPISRQIDTHPEWVAKDGLHPSSAQYKAWVDAILNVVLLKTHE